MKDKDPIVNVTLSKRNNALIHLVLKRLEAIDERLQMQEDGLGALEYKVNKIST